MGLGYHEIMKRLFVPSHENDYRGWLLHIKGLFVVAFLSLTIALNYGRWLGIIGAPVVLGETSRLDGKKVIELINKIRHENGLKRLKVNPLLSQAARMKANDMIKRGYWSHKTPEGKSPWVFIEKAGYQYQVAGENLAKGFRSDQELVKAWVRSPLHRKNLLDKDFQEVGIGIDYGKLNGVYTSVVVLYLAKPLDNKGVQLIKQVSAYEGKGLDVSKKMNKKNWSWYIDVGWFKLSFAGLILLLLLVAVIVDFWQVEKMIPKRYHSRSRLHLVFLGVLLILIILVHPAGLVK